MEQIMKKVFTTFFYFVLCLVLMMFESIKYAFTGKKVIGRVVIIAGYAGLVELAVFKSTGFWIVLGIVAVIVFIFALSMTMSGNTSKTSDEYGYEESKTNYQSNKGQKIPFFDGMTFEEAKKEYRRLMKQYHPDNENGSLEMSQKISAAYSNYRNIYGR